MRTNNIFVSGPKFTKLFSTNVGGIVGEGDHLLFGFSISLSVQGIFALKSKVVQNRAEVLTFLPI